MKEQQAQYPDSSEKQPPLWKDRKHIMWFPFTFTKYLLEGDRLYTERGFFNTHYDELLLYRITDLCLTRTFLHKLFRTGTITLYTRIDTSKEIYLENIKHPREVKQILSEAIEAARDSRGLIRKDFFGGSDADEEHDL